MNIGLIIKALIYTIVYIFKRLAFNNENSQLFRNRIKTLEWHIKEREEYLNNYKFKINNIIKNSGKNDSFKLFTGFIKLEDDIVITMKEELEYNINKTKKNRLINLFFCIPKNCIQFNFPL